MPPATMRMMKKIRSRWQCLWRLIRRLVTLGFLLLLCLLAGNSLVNVARYRLNLVSDNIPLSGTGSMYPTFPKGETKTPEEQAHEVVSVPGMQRYPSGVTVLGRQLWGYSIGRGDIISFINDKTKEITRRDTGVATGFVKRVVGVAGDVLEIRDGSLLVNGAAAAEPFTARARSTFGGSFIPECQQVTVPAGSLAVMGDNRKGSSDSRHELGFVAVTDVSHVIPWSKQPGVLSAHWRDISGDLNESARIVLDAETYLQLLNQKRQSAGVKPLKFNAKLQTSAAKRGEVILRYNDFSFEASRSGYTMAKALREAGYANIVWGEAPTQGYYEAEELLENQFTFPDSRKFLLDPDYQELGIAEVHGEINGCPTQVIVQHFGGYRPPNYSADDIAGWKTALTRLREIQPSWERLKDYPEFYAEHRPDADRMLQIISQRIRSIEAIVARMEANQWLTAEERRAAEQDEGLAREQEALAGRLNSP